MLVQVLAEYKNRTEYRLLDSYCTCEVVSINSLNKGVLVLPGIVLGKMQKDELSILDLWLEHNHNQLILLPSWNEISLRGYLNISVDINIKKVEGMFEKIPVLYEIKATVKDRLFFEDGKTYGINYRNNLSSGLITVVTLPLLDYKLVQFEDTLKQYFNGLIQRADYTKEISTQEDANLNIDDIHVFIIILSSAEVNLTNNMALEVYKYFGVRLQEKELIDKYNELVIGGYIESNRITDKGISIVKERNLKMFIRVIKERREKNSGWE